MQAGANPKRRMKRILAVVCAAVLLSSPALARQGSQYIIKQRAKELRDQNNVRQGVVPPAQAAPAAPATTAPAPPALSPSLLRFQTDLGTISASAPATAEQKQKLAQQVVAGAQGAKPSLTTAGKLATDLSAAFAEKPLSPTSRARLVQELDAVLNPGKYPMAKLDGIFADVQAIFQENGLSRTKAVGIADDVKAISAEIQRGGAK